MIETIGASVAISCSLMILHPSGKTHSLLFITFVAASPLVKGMTNDEEEEFADNAFSFNKAHLSPIVLLPITIITFLCAYYLQQSNKKSHSPIPNTLTVPGGHWLIGHYKFISDPKFHDKIFKDYSTPSGITAFWSFGNKAASVLRADHARVILRQSEERTMTKFIARHGKKTVGEEGLILLEGGTRWRKQRNVVQNAFTVESVKQARKVTMECALDFVDCLIERGIGIDGGIEVGPLFKAFTLDVFGKDALGYDFGCISNARKDITKFKLPLEAEALTYLQKDLGKRVEPKAVLDPRKQLYWVPTSHNREYHDKFKLVENLLSSIIGAELDRLLHADTDNDLAEAKVENRKRPKNIVARLLLSAIEEKSGALSSAFTSSKCPFNAAASSPPSAASKLDRKHLIDYVAKMLQVLLIGGYETTAVSLSYAMYFLSKHPRCQERCSEEAIRVLGQRKRKGGNNGANMDCNRSDVVDDPETFDDDQLVYCRALFLETLRLHSPFMFTTRTLTKDTTLDWEDGNGGDACTSSSKTTIAKSDHRNGARVSHPTVTLPKGTRCFIHLTRIHEDERNFERATEFLPERWVRWEQYPSVDNGRRSEGRWIERDYSKESQSKLEVSSTAPVSSKYSEENAHADSISAANPRNYFAFSDGARNCVGKRLAIMEGTICIAAIMRDLRVDLAKTPNGEEFVLEKKRKFVSLSPKSMPIIFRTRD